MNPEYSSVVPAAAQQNAYSGALDSLGSFLGSLVGIAKPVADVVAAVQSPKTTQTNNTGDGQKTLTPTASAPSPAPQGNKTALIVGGAVVGLVALYLITRK